MALPGSGTQSDPWQISNIDDLQSLQFDADLSLSDYYVLTSNIDGTGYDAQDTYGSMPGGSGFVPIGSSHDSNETGRDSTNFSGTLDGQGYTISNITMDWTGYDIGIISYTTGALKNIVLDGIDTTGNNGYMASLTGTLDGATVDNITLRNCTLQNASGVTGTANVGVLCSFLSNAIDVNDVTIESSSVTIADADESIGVLNGTYSTTNGTISNVTVDNCDVTVNNTIGFAFGLMSGGIGRGAETVFEKCSVKNSSIDISGGYQIGAIAGQVNLNSGSNLILKQVKSVSNTITGDRSMGGLLGDLNDNGLTIENSYARDITLNASDQSTGMMLGQTNGNTVDILTSYAAVANITTGDSTDDIVVGADNGTFNITDCYVDVSSTNRSTNNYFTDLSTSQMTGSDAPNNMTGFDFGTSGIWLTGVTSTDYPRLNALTILNASTSFDIGVDNAQRIVFDVDWSGFDDSAPSNYTIDLDGTEQIVNGLEPSEHGVYSRALDVSGTTGTSTVTVNFESTGLPRKGDIEIRNIRLDPVT